MQGTRAKSLGRRGASAAGRTGTLQRRNRSCTSTRARALFRNNNNDDDDIGREGERGKGKMALASAGIAALVATSPISGAAIASEFDVLEAPVPETSYIVDDGGILSKAGKGAIKGKLIELEKTTGYHLNVVTMRKLQFTPDPFEFSDKVLENWYPTLEQGNNKGVLLIITSTKEGGISGGPSFLGKVGDDILDGVISETIPSLAAEEKWNEATLKSVQRIEAGLQGKADPFAPKAKKARKTLTQEEVKGNFNFLFAALAVIIIGTPLAQTVITNVMKKDE
ncbi:hypothetical protein A3770_07p49850 [Chloropicon primus]|uniref:TPM domain-containing protein n=2 Tax=Chloropicon primus TaxID=1764295 RepID=A0A5B8MPV4_9CHLO|nr:hypothetical protein A3770_07p49850 [Chloropicon primus]|eukprot:QDZ22467.1 hypothetical protein A3770_07p49850 [Chloropicon primus]